MPLVSGPFIDSAAPNIGLMNYERVTAEMRKAAPGIPHLREAGTAAHAVPESAVCHGTPSR